MANVLSTTTRAPREWARAETAGMSVMASSGLDGVSTQTILVSGRQAARMVSRLVSEVVEWVSPRGPHTALSRRNVPP